MIGLSEDLFKLISSKVPGLNVDFFKEYCHLFLIFPSFLTLLS